MSQTSIEFIQAVWTKLEATGPTDFARKLGLGPDGLQKVRRWRGGGRLDYEDVMIMLRRTGWRIETDDVDATEAKGSQPEPVAADQPGIDRLEVRLEEGLGRAGRILANQDTALKVQNDMLDQLEGIQGELRELRTASESAPSAARTAPKQKRGRR